MRWLVAVAVLALASCSAAPVARPLSPAPVAARASTTTIDATTTTKAPADSTTTVATTTTLPVRRFGSARIVLVGDVMLGRSMARVVRSDGESIFREVRHIISRADLAAGNMESPLTLRPHIASNPHTLEADPASAELLRRAGFDVMSVANNHAGDAGRASIVDSLDALRGAGIKPVGGGLDASEARAPVILDMNGFSLGFVAFDVSRAGTPASARHPGIAHWDVSAPAAVAELASSVDVAIVSLHGGVEYSLSPDRHFAEAIDTARAAGADIVWGHGPHVMHPVTASDGSLVASSLGNFVFDQPFPGTYESSILEVLVSADGVVAHREIPTEHRDRRIHLSGSWGPPGTAVFLYGEWWSLDIPAVVESGEAVDLTGFGWGEPIDAGSADVDGDGRDEVVVAFRRAFKANLVNAFWAKHPWPDGQGHTSHLGVFETDGFRKKWSAGSVPTPIEGIAICGPVIGVVQDGLVSAWEWRGFGFVASLPIGGKPGCVDVDGDAVADLVVTGR